MGISASKIGADAITLAKKVCSDNQKPITTGLNYTMEAINDSQDPFAKYIPSIIKKVDEYIAQSGKKFSAADREDMIQEAIFASFQITKKPNYANSINPCALRNNGTISGIKKAEKEIVKNGNNASLSDVTQTCTIEDMIAESSGKTYLKETMDEILKTLTPREETIIRARYGLNENNKIYTREEIAKMFQVTLERIRETEAKALKKLRHPKRAGIARKEIFVSSNGTIYSLGTNNFNKK